VRTNTSSRWRAEALEAAKELFPGHRVTVVLKEGEPGT
jgi:hypothetical protein